MVSYGASWLLVALVCLIKQSAGAGGTCNFGDSLFGPEAVGFCDQLGFFSGGALYDCMGGNIKEISYPPDTQCSGFPTNEGFITGQCGASDTGCTLYLVKFLVYTDSTDCTGDFIPEPFEMVVTDGASNLCNGFFQYSNIDLNGYTLDIFENDDGCDPGGNKVASIEFVNNGCGVLSSTFFGTVSNVAQISVYPGALYEGVATPMNYEDAENYCQNTFGTSLATINSDQDNAEVRIAADEMGATGDLLWIGLNRVGGFDGKWNDGSELDYTNMYDFEGDLPNKGLGPSKQCAAMNEMRGDQWVPRTCDNEFPFVCNGPNGLYGTGPRPVAMNYP